MADSWKIWPQRQQPVEKDINFTHTRRVDLPLALHVEIDSEVYNLFYEAHGLIKTTFAISPSTPFPHCSRFSYAGMVFKITPRLDIEPGIFEKHRELGIFTFILAVNWVVEETKWGPRNWFAWIAERVEPLDFFLKASRVHKQNCILSAATSLVTAAMNKHIIDDNGLHNFGVRLHSTTPSAPRVVILDAGSRDSERKLTKREFNEICMKRFWKKMRWHVEPEDYQAVYNIWTSRSTLEEVAPLFHDACCQIHSLYANPVIEKEDISADSNWSQQRETTCLNDARVEPGIQLHVSHARALLCDTLDDEAHASYDWLRDHVFTRNGIVSITTQEHALMLTLQHKSTPADVKLDVLIRVTQERRQMHLGSLDPQTILNEKSLELVLESWKKDYETWMSEEKIAAAWACCKSWSHWRQTLRSTFRVFLDQIVGCSYVVIYFLVAPFSLRNLQIFQEVWKDPGFSTSDKKLKEAKHRVRTDDAGADAEDRIRDAVQKAARKCQPHV